MSNNKQQTALSFFLMGLIDLEIGKYFSNNQLIELHHLFNKAKEMEKNQIMDANEDLSTANGLQYYNQTFGDESNP